MKKLNELPSDLKTHLGYWLRHVSNHVSGEFARSLQRRNLSVAEWVALRQMYEAPGIAPGELASSLSMTRGAISKIIEKLEGKGLVDRTTKTDDKRGQSLKMTPKGGELLPKLAEIADRNDEQFFGCLSADERANLNVILRKVADFHHWSDVPTK